MELDTTDDPTCDQRWKNVEYLQLLGCTKSTIYEIRSEGLETPSSPAPLGIPEEQAGYLTSIVLGWSYILSARWVEILQRAGEKASMLHYQGDDLVTCF